MNPTFVRTLNDQRNHAQRQRIRLTNRLSAHEAGSDVLGEQEVAYIQKKVEDYQAEEAEATDALIDAVKDEPIVELVTSVKGIGLTLAAKLVAAIDIHRASTISSLWKYSGVGLNAEGERDRPRKGEKLPYNAELKKDGFLIASSFLKARSPYSLLYYNYRDEYQDRGWTKNHAHLGAMRRMYKVFLAHLWLGWRMIEGLPITLPFVHEKLGHEHFLDPKDYGWPFSTEDINAYKSLQAE